MKRLVPAMLAGAAVTGLLVYLMIRLIAIDEPEQTGQAVVLPVQAVEPLSVSAVPDVRQDPDCERRESEFAARLAQSRSCELDSDCTLAGFGCPFGCVTSVNKSALEALSLQGKTFQAQCHRCVYVCPAPVFERRAACVGQRCVVWDRPVREFEQETLELINGAE